MTTRRDIDTSATADPRRPSAMIPGGPQMWLYEELARERIRDAEQRARHRRLVREATAGRRWSQLARFAARRAERVRCRV